MASNTKLDALALNVSPVTESDQPVPVTLPDVAPVSAQGSVFTQPATEKHAETEHAIHHAAKGCESREARNVVLVSSREVVDRRTAWQGALSAVAIAMVASSRLIMIIIPSR